MFSNQAAPLVHPLELRGCAPVPVFAPEHTVRRDEILQRLIPPVGDSNRLRLLLTAPPGFGKTALAAQLAAALGNRCVWLSLGASGSGPRLLLDSLFHAVQIVLANRGKRQLIWEELSSVPIARPQIEATVALLADAITDAGPDARFTLVCEDLHRLDQVPLSRFVIEQVWATLPPWIDMVLTARTATVVSPLQGVPGGLQHLTAEDLRLTVRETAALTDTLLGYQADRQTHQAIYAHAGGMPAITAALALLHGRRGRDLPLPAVTTELSACYEEVVNTLPPELQRRLFQAAGCGLLDGAALGALFGRKIGSNILTAIRSALPFVYRLGDSRTYRFVDSFYQYLQQHEACLFQPNRSQRLYRLALYHAAARAPGPALECAARCCHYGLINDLLGIFGVQLFAAPDEHLLRRTIAPIPASVVRAMPWLALFSALLSGDDQRRTALLEGALQRFTEGDRKDGLLLSLYALIEHRLLTGTATGNTAAHIRQLEKLFVYLRGDLPPALYTKIAHLLAIGYCVIFGRTGKTELYLTMASLADKRGSRGRTAATALVVSALRFAFQADVPALTGVLARSSHLLLNETSAPSSFGLLTYARLNVLVLRGDFGNYRRLAARLPTEGPGVGPEVRILRPYLSMFAGDAALADGNYREALQSLDNGLLVIDGDSQPHLYGLLLQFKALALALLQMPAAATEAITRATALQSGTAGHPYVLLHHQVAAMVWYHLGQFGEGDRHLQRAAQLENLIDFPFRWTDARWHQAYCLLHAGRKEQALACIGEALHAFRTERRRHCLCLVPSVLQAVLHAAIHADIERPYAHELLARRLRLGCNRRGELLPLLQITVLRHQAITGDGRLLPFHELTTHERKLLFHLAQAGAMRSPQAIVAEELWPEKEPERQRSSLDNLISRLRTKLKTLVPPASTKDYLAIDQGYVTLSLCSVDVIEFLDAMNEAETSAKQGHDWDAGNAFARAFAALDETILQPPDFEYLETLQGRFEQKLTDGVAAYVALLGRQRRQHEAARHALTAFRYCPFNPRLTRLCHDLLQRCQDPAGAESVLHQYRQAHQKTTSDPAEMSELLAMVFS
jgi:DNA-binding SARP family transcriptional activator/tetratricopeptide (TPR) repeat protein